MAGWDGDALAESMEQALERQEEADEARRVRREESSPEGRVRKGLDESRRLSKARLEAQLSHATNPAHRTMLERALKSFETESPPVGEPETNDD